MGRAEQGVDVRGKNVLIKYSICGLILAFAVSLSMAGVDNRDSGKGQPKAIASGNVKIAQAEREGLPLAESSDQPIEITSKKANAKKTTNGQELTFEGNVKAMQGNFTLTCDRLTVIYDQKKKNGSESQENSRKLTIPKESGEFKSATALGNVKVVQVEKKRLPSGEMSDQAREITSRKALAAAKSQEIIFEGNVQAIQDNATLTCDRIVVNYDHKTKNGSEPDRSKGLPNMKETGAFKSATALGNVKVVQNDTKAVAGKALFDGVKNTITLTENPKIWRGLDWGTASIITIYLNENHVETESSKFILNPGKM